jgi:hypothetical protein
MNGEISIGVVAQRLSGIGVEDFDARKADGRTSLGRIREMDLIGEVDLATGAERHGGDGNPDIERRRRRSLDYYSSDGKSQKESTSHIRP